MTDAVKMSGSIIPITSFFALSFLCRCCLLYGDELRGNVVVCIVYVTNYNNILKLARVIDNTVMVLIPKIASEWARLL